MGEITDMTTEVLTAKKMMGNVFNSGDSVNSNDVMIAVIDYGFFLGELGKSKNKTLLKITSDCSMIKYTYDLAMKYNEVIDIAGNKDERTALFFHDNQKEIRKNLEKFEKCIIRKIKNVNS